MSDRIVDGAPSYQEILDQDPSPRLIVDKQGKILFSNQASAGVLTGLDPHRHDQSIGEFVAGFGGEEETNNLIKSSSEGQEATTFLSINSPQGPRLLQWTVKNNGEYFYFYGQNLEMIDSVTGLPNRAYLEAEIKRNDTLRQLPVSILFVDGDNLKSWNDQNDHSVGDTYLFLIAQILAHSLRADDILGRWGGDEDLVILPRTTSETASMLYERITANKNELNSYLSGNTAEEDLSPPVRAVVGLAKNHPGFYKITAISFTVGIDTLEFGSKRTLREVVDNADQLMLHHKKNSLSEDQMMDRLEKYINP